jgi:hypothetical protein
MLNHRNSSTSAFFHVQSQVTSALVSYKYTRKLQAQTRKLQVQTCKLQVQTRKLQVQTRKLQVTLCHWFRVGFVIDQGC